MTPGRTPKRVLRITAERYSAGFSGVADDNDVMCAVHEAALVVEEDISTAPLASAGPRSAGAPPSQ